MTILFIILFILIQLIIIYLVLIKTLHKNDYRKLNLSKLINNSKNLTKVLAIYPHPDDETMASGGLLKKLSENKKFDTYVVSLTAGEKGTELLKINSTELANVRKQEFKNAVTELGVSNFEIWDFKDAKVREDYDAIKSKLRNYIKEHNFDLVITYERTGMYGHPDHIDLSKMVNELDKEMDSFKVLYSTLPKNIIDKANLPKQLTIDGEVFMLDKNVIQAPQYKLGIFRELFAKYKAAKKHKSQKLSGSLPLWFEMVIMPYEYYTEVYDENRE